MFSNQARASLPLILGIATVGLSSLAAWTLRSRSDPPSRSQLAVATSEAKPAPALPRGKLLFQVHCVRCHGPEGRGDGPDSAELRPPPRDFTSGRSPFGSSPEAIARTIVDGIPGTAMYATGKTFSDREREALVEYVQTLAQSGFEARLKAGGFDPRREMAGSFEVEDLQGGKRRLEFQPSGLVKLVIFWGTSCAPCLDELPKLQRLAEAFADRGFKVIPVCVDEPDRDRVARAIRGKFDHFPSFLSEDPMARVRYDIQALPVAALINRDGSLVGIARGAVDWEGEPLRTLVDGLLNPTP